VTSVCCIYIGHVTTGLQRSCDQCVCCIYLGHVIAKPSSKQGTGLVISHSNLRVYTDAPPEGQPACLKKNKFIVKVQIPVGKKNITISSVVTHQKFFQYCTRKFCA